MSKYVKLNPKSSIFFDQASKIKVISGEVVELTESQYQLRVIKAALHNGYLQNATEEEFKKAGQKKAAALKEEKEPVKAPINVEELQAKFKALVEEGKEAGEIKEKFNTEELKALAESYDIQPEEGDTKATLVEAILEELAEQE